MSHTLFPTFAAKRIFGRADDDKTPGRSFKELLIWSRASASVTNHDRCFLFSSVPIRVQLVGPQPATERTQICLRPWTFFSYACAFQYSDGLHARSTPRPSSDRVDVEAPGGLDQTLRAHT